MDVSADRCDLGAQRINVKVTLRSLVPEGRDFPPSVVGLPEPGRTLGDMLINVYGYAPVGGRVDEVRVDGNEVASSGSEHMGRTVHALTVEIPRGGKRVVEFVMYSDRGQSGRVHLITTPGVKDSGIGRIGPSAC